MLYFIYSYVGERIYKAYLEQSHLIPSCSWFMNVCHQYLWTAFVDKVNTSRGMWLCVRFDRLWWLRNKQYI